MMKLFLLFSTGKQFIQTPCFIRKKHITASGCFLICTLTSYLFGQDIHFSQFYMTPLAVNPSFTASFNGDQRVIINHKDQWRAVGSPYQTSMLSFDMGLFKKKWKNSYLGTGMMVFRDKAGDTQLGTTQVNFSLSSNIAIGSSQRIAAGIQGGFAQRSINTSKMQWESQFDGKTFTGASSGETNTFEPYAFGDFSAGLSWNYGTEASSLSSNNEFKANAGVAVFHLNRPQQKFNAFEEVDRLHTKIISNFGLHIGIGNTNIAVQPSAFYAMQGPSREITFGSFVRYQVREASKYTNMMKETAISLGGYMRAKDAFIPSVLVEYASFAMGITYDVNISNLKNASNGRGGVEVSLRYINPNPFRGGATKSVRFL